jgi:hypothetical protein
MNLLHSFTCHFYYNKSKLVPVSTLCAKKAQVLWQTWRKMADTFLTLKLGVVDRRMNGLQGRSWRYDKEGNTHTYRESDFSHYVDVTTQRPYGSPGLD